MYRLGSFPTTGFPLGKGEPARGPFKKIISVSYNTLGPLVISSVCFLSQMHWGPISLVQIPGIEVPRGEYEHFTPLGEAPDG